MANTQTYQLDLGASKLIDKYEKALKEMENAGLSKNITGGLIKQFERLSNTYKTLSKEGERGFTNSREISSYETRVMSLMRQFSKFEQSLDSVNSKVSKSIEKLNQQKNKTGEVLEKSLKNLPKKDIEDYKKRISSATSEDKKMKVAEEALNAELEKRVGILKKAEDALDKAQKKQENSLSSVVNKGLERKSVEENGKNRNIFTKAESNKLSEEQITKLRTEAARLIKTADDVEIAWERMIKYINKNKLETGFAEGNKDKSSGLELFKKQFEQVFEEATKVKSEIQEIQEATAKVYLAQSNVKGVGQITGKGVGKQWQYNENQSDSRAIISQIKAEIAAQEKLNEVLDGKKVKVNEAANAQKNLSNITQKVQGAAFSASEEFQKTSKALKTTAKDSEMAANGFNMLKSRIMMFFSVTSVFSTIRNQIKKTYEDVKELDKSFASIAMVTDKSVQQMWSSYSEYAQMASDLGQKTNDIIKASALFYQQGLDTANALSLTTDTMKLATLAGNSYEQATQEMTSAIRGFKMEMTEGSHVTDVYSTLAASAAASVDGIAQAMARTASIANSAGMSFENTSAFLTQMIETTQESAENIGTSLKTIIARFTELKENVSGTSASEFEDLDYNKVDKALKSVGISIKDATGQFRNLDEVFLELSKKWDTLDRNTQRYVATIAAGSRQQSRFIAMMDNYDRTVELIEKTEESTGKADAQFAKYADTMEYKLNVLNTKWEEFRVTFLNSNFFKSILDELSSFIDRVNDLDLKNPLDIGRIISAFAIGIPMIRKSLGTMFQSYQNTFDKMTKLGQTAAKDLETKVFNKLNRKSQIKDLKLEASIKEINVKNSDLVKKVNKAQTDINKKIQEMFTRNSGKTIQIPEKLSIQLQNGEIQNIEQLRSAILSLKESGDIASGSVSKFTDFIGQNEEKIKETIPNILQLSNAIKKNNQEIQQNEQALQKQKNALDNLGKSTFDTSVALARLSAAGIKVLTTTLQSSGFAIMGVLTHTMSLMDALKMTAMQAGIQLISTSTSYVATKIEEAQAIFAAKTVDDVATRKRLRNAKLVEGENTVVANSWWEIFAAENAVVAPLTIIAAALLAVGAAAIGIYALSQYLDTATNSAKKLANVQQQLKDAQSDASIAENTAKTEKKNLQNAEELKNKYDELNNIQNRTNEQQEEYKEITSEIVEQIPDVVLNYNEMNGELVVANNLWDAILEKQRKAAGKANEEEFGANVKVTDLERQENQLQTEKVERQYNDALNGFQETQVKILNALSWGAGYWFDSSDFSLFTELMGIDAPSQDEMWEIYHLFTTSYEDLTEEQKKTYDDFQTLLKEWHLRESGRLEDSSKEIKASSQLNLQKYLEGTGMGKGEAFLRSAFVSEYSIDDLIDPKSLYTGQFIEKVGGGVYWRNTSDSNAGITKSKFKNSTWDQLDTKTKEYIEIGTGDTDGRTFYEENVEKGTSAANTAIYEAWRAGVITKRLEEIADDVSVPQEGISVIDNFLLNKDTMSKQDLTNTLTSFKEGDTRNAVEGLIQPSIDEIDEVIKGLQNVLGKDSDFEKWGSSALKSYSDSIEAIKKAAPSTHKEQANEYLQYINSLFDNKDIKPEDRASFLESLDFSSVSILNFDEFKEQTLENIKKTFDGITDKEAEDIFSGLAEKASGAGIYSTSLSNEEDFDKYMKKVQKVADIFNDNATTFAKYLGQNKDIVDLTVDEYGEVSEIVNKLSEAGAVGAKSVLDYNEQTKKWTLDTSKLSEILINNTDKVVKNLKSAQSANRETIKSNQEIIAQNEEQIKELEKKSSLSEEEQTKLTELKTENETLETQNEFLEDNTEEIEDQLGAVKSLNQQVKENVELWKKASYWIEKASGLSEGFSDVLSDVSSDGGTLTADTIESFSKTLDELGMDLTKYVGKDLTVNVKTLYEDVLKQIDEQVAEGRYENATEEEILQLIAIRREIVNEYNEYLEDEKEKKEKEEKELEDVKKKIEDAQKAVKKANDDYEKQLETIADKQKALNDKLKEYAELLYGTANRKSTLDFFYNYDEAIKSLNDEIQRAKDLLSDSESIGESTEALQRYAKATHNLIVEQTAKQQMIQAGLNNYANMIENGGVSYSDAETGRSINVNFGDYVKKDERTGKYILDQQLLNQAQFNDSYKDLIEENVSTYNEYVDELLASEDEVRKAEKELQEERKNALKGYTTMEKEIAEALKAQYQEEVDNLKEKYDSMKEADDDYVSALEEAIEKQRELRERENKWEELAEKEKRLSLMQRDTSGANAIETQNLENEVQEDRQQLLDDAIDSIIDGLSDLYESQQELRDSEIELKEALLDNTLYWNTQAEGLAASFTSTEEYMEFMSQLSTEFAELTLAQQQEKLNEYGETYASATEYMAMLAMDASSETGDFIVDTVTFSGEEISQVVTDTSQTFTDEVTRAYNETTDAFNEDLQKAEEEIQNAKQDLQDAIEKLAELSTAADEAAKELAEAYAAQQAYNELQNNKQNGDWANAPSVNNNNNDNTPAYQNYHAADEIIHDFDAGLLDGPTAVKALKREGYTYYWVPGPSGAKGKLNRKYAEGGLVNYTGPAWVDGTPSKPEAFLSAEDTERIGNAAKILADIPWMERETDESSVVTNNAGDVNIEINLNIDNLSSDIDIDDMLERVKNEIVEVANPLGANTILQQQI